jgi:hypothetical protein
VTDETESLVLEHLRAIRSDVGRMKDDMSGLRMEMTAMRHDMAGVRTLQDMHYGDIAALKVRLERIERRLDLID